MPASISKRMIFTLLLIFASPNNALLPILPPASSRSFTVNSTYISPRCLGKYGCDPNNQDIRECSCQPYCYLFDSCCAESLRPDTRGQGMPSDLYSCLQASQLTGGFLIVDNNPYLYVVDRCPNGDSSSSLMSAYCQHPVSSIHNGTLSAPVTHTVTMVTYRNIYCALCNNVSRADVVSWIAQQICYSGSDYPSIRAPDSDICTTGYVKPDTNGTTYSCRPDVLRSCPLSAKMLPPDVVTACSNGPTAYVYDLDRRKIYRNWNCTLCDSGALVNGQLTLTNGTFECTMWQTSPQYSFPASAKITSGETSKDYHCPTSFSGMASSEIAAWQQVCPVDFMASAAVGSRAHGRSEAAVGFVSLLALTGFSYVVFYINLL